MNLPNTRFDTNRLLERVEASAAAGEITEGAAKNIRLWLRDDAYSDYLPELARHIEEQLWSVLDDVFWTVIPFGTGGRRGKMYSIGSNAINTRTIGESAKGLADYVIETKPEGPWACAIAYDTRHRSREFAELCAGIMVANGFDVFFIDRYRSTPELSYLIRYKKCDCGIMVTASHNPPSDNAVKVYGSNGAQLIPPHDKHVINKVGEVKEIIVADFDQAVLGNKVHICTDEVDAALLKQHILQSSDGPRDIKVIFSPLHGVGEFNVKSLLNAVGFEQLEIYEPHREPNGDFPNVPGHVSNPENPEVFEAMIEYARETGTELILASDPDCDRMGAAAPMTLDPSGPWKTFNGNQLGVLLADYVLGQRKAADTISSANFVVTTLVTTMMIKRLTEAYGARCFNENLVGFKWICNVVDREGPDDFVFGTEESHGYLVGTYARDKDGAIACLLMTELAAKCKAERITLFDRLDQLYRMHGYHSERLLTVRMEGSDGMKRMQKLMDKLRTDGPEAMGGMSIKATRDFKTLERRYPDGRVETFQGPQDNLIILESAEAGNYVAVRPSGTEPKVKMYMFTFVSPDELDDLAATKRAMETRMDEMERDLRAFSDSIPG